MPIVSTPRGYVVLDGAGGFVAGPFATPQEASRTVMQQALAPPVAPPRRPTPVAIPNEAGTYSITAGDGTGRVVAGPYGTKDDANRTLAGWSLIDLMKPAPAPLRALADVGVGHKPYNRINITPGYRSPDVEDGRDAKKPAGGKK